MDKTSRDEIQKAVFDSLRAVAPDVGPLEMDTHLIGTDAVVDSVGFISLLIALEQTLQNRVDLSASFLEQQGVPEADNPFLSIRSLTAHLERMLSP